MSEREEQRFSSPLESERGSTTIQDSVVYTIAGLAAREIEGVDMGGGASRAAGGVLERVTGSQVLSRGISVEVGKIETAIEVTIAIEYGRNIPQLAERVRNKITERVESLTGLRVVELNVTVGDIVFPEEEEGRLGEQGSRPRQARQTEEFEAGDDRERESALEARGQEHVRVESTPTRDETAELELGEETQERPPTGEDETRRIG
ncbi:MAG: Asp23/Gls24 family envelope stress response protein [Actinomycetota bacterium]|nr:Asp23/Gls24 family envelope stress response protein [Actinomycetota bacterium]